MLWKSTDDSGSESVPPGGDAQDGGWGGTVLRQCDSGLR